MIIWASSRLEYNVNASNGHLEDDLLHARVVLLVCQFSAYVAQASCNSMEPISYLYSAEHDSYFPVFCYVHQFDFNSMPRWLLEITTIPGKTEYTSTHDSLST